MNTRRGPCTAMAGSSVLTLAIVVILAQIGQRPVGGESKLYYGQRIFTDVHIVNFADPAKHGFHIILDEEFVKTHLQPVHLPTVYASAISLKPPSWKRSEREKAVANGQKQNKTSSSSSLTVSSGSSGPNYPTRVTKILYPEKGDPENGLLDGRTIKLLGLQERSWYYVCVEFESNVNRHELATGTTCQLKRTLDKFGKSVDSTISEIELVAVSDRSIAVQLVVDADFPVRLHAYLTGGESPESPTIAGGGPTADVPVQTFVVKQSQTLNIDFGPFLRADTTYGSLCILEEPLPTGNAYTPMGRSVEANLEHCYFDDLKTKPLEKQQRSRESGMGAAGQSPPHQMRHIERSATMGNNGASRLLISSSTLSCLILVLIRSVLLPLP